MAPAAAAKLDRGDWRPDAPCGTLTEPVPAGRLMADRLSPIQRYRRSAAGS